MPIRIHKLVRQRALPNAGGHTLFFQTEGGGRRRPPAFFRPGEVPEFEGESAWFEIEKLRGGRRRVVRRVHPDGRPFED